MPSSASHGGYLVEQTAGSVIRNTFRIFRKHFVPLASIQIATVAVPNIIYVHASRTGQPDMALLGQLLQIFMSVPAYLGVVALVSDVCLDNPVRTWRAVRKGYLLVTPRLILLYLALVISTVIGSILLVIPGLMVTAWYMFAVPVLILESGGVRAALARSKALGFGFYRRNVIVWLASLMVAIVPVYVFITALFTFVLIVEPATDNLMADVVVGVLMVLGLPLFTISGVLLYYDMRVRKEGFDRTRLTEELKI